jgi:hypothetical protein
MSSRKRWILRSSSKRIKSPKPKKLKIYKPLINENLKNLTKKQKRVLKYIKQS